VRQPILLLIFFAVVPGGGEVHAAGGEGAVKKEADSPTEKPSCNSLPPTTIKDPAAFLFIAEYGPLEWPAGSRRVRSMLIEKNGSTQYAEREDAGTVLTIREGPSDCFTLFDPLIAAWPPPMRLPESDPDTLGEDHPGYLSLCFVCPGDESRFWEGSEQSLSLPWREALSEAWQAMAVLPEVEDPVVAAWLVATLLSPGTAREKEEAGVVEAIDDEHLEASPLLNQSLCQPFRLLPLREGENPFSTLGWTGYTPARSTVNLDWQEQVYHVRTFMKGAR
jgi:hypothetical protein